MALMWRVAVNENREAKGFAVGAQYAPSIPLLKGTLMTEAEYGEYIAMFNAACAGDGSAPHVVFEHRIENGDRGTH